MEVKKGDRLRDREEEKQREREEQARQKQLSAVEVEIAAVEKEIARLEVEMNRPGFFDDPQRGAEAGEQHAASNIRLEELYKEWEGLSG